MKKRIISFLTVLTLLFSLVYAIPAHAEIEHDENLYIDLGILPLKKTAGLIKPTLSREQFAQILVRMQGIDYLSEYEENLATDIERSKYKNEINFCIENEYLSLDEEGRFYPSGDISYEVAVRAMIYVLEYDVLIKDKANIGEYIKIANSLGILRGVKAQNREKLGYNELYIIISRSMKANLPIHENIDRESVETLYDRLNIAEHSGVLLANSRTSAGVERTSKNNVNIDGTIYSTKLDIKNELVGAEVVFYVNTDDEVVSLSPKRPLESVTIYPSDIKSIAESADILTIKCSDDIGDIRIKKAAVAIVNNKTMAPTRALFNSFCAGSAVFVDTNRDSEYDVLHMDIAKTVAVAAVSAESYSIRAKHTDELFSLEKAEKNLEIYKNDKQASFGDIKKDAIVSIMCDAFTFDSDGNIVYDYENISWAKVYISDMTANGLIDSMDEDIVYIDDMDYKVAHSFTNLVKTGKVPALKLNDYINARLDCYGLIADAEVDKENGGYSYGYLIKAGLIQNTMTPTLEMKIMNEDGVIDVYQASERFFVDGVLFKKHAMTYDVGAEDDTDLSKRQVISFRLANDGKVRSIDTVVQSSKEDAFALSVALPFDPYDYPTVPQTKYVIRTSVVGKNVAIGKDCVVFLDQAGLGDTNPEDYYFSIVDSSTIAESDGSYIALYDADEMRSAKCAAIWESYTPEGPTEEGNASKESVEYTINSYLVEKIRVTFDKDRNEAYELTLVNYGGKLAYETVTADMLNFYSIKASSRAEQISSWTHTSGSAVRPKADTLLVHRHQGSELPGLLKRGDLVRITRNTEGKITYLERIVAFEALEATPIPFTGTSGTNMVFANLYKTSDGVYMYEVPGRMGEYEIFNTMDRAGVVVYDVNKKEATVYSDLSMAPSMSTGDNAMVWLRDYHNGRTREYFVYLY